MSRTAFRLRRDESGGAVVEFVLILPVMLLLMLGSIEALQMVEAHRRVAHVAAAIGDLIAQEPKTSNADLGNVFVAGTLLMAPLDASSLGQQVASYGADKDGKVSLLWSKTSGPYAGPSGLPAGYVLKPNQGVVVADVSYDYKPTLRWVLPTSINMKKRHVFRPRGSDYVVKTD